MTRFCPYGARMDMFCVSEMQQRIGVIQVYLCSRVCWPCLHSVASVSVYGRSFSRCKYAPGPMWSADLGMPSLSLAVAGSRSQHGPLSHSRCFARILDTSVVAVTRRASCRMLRLASLPTMVRRILKSVSSRSVPSNTMKKGCMG